MDRFARTENNIHACVDLDKYCGGTFEGIMIYIDYIAELGFNAIMISPVVENFENSYHGNHITNLY